jgi:hypothetical protein
LLTFLRAAAMLQKRVIRKLIVQIAIVSVGSSSSQQ